MDKQRVPNLIVDGIFLGNYSASRNKEFLEQNNITHILTVACDIEPEFPSVCVPPLCCLIRTGFYLQNCRCRRLDGRKLAATLWSLFQFHRRRPKSWWCSSTLVSQLVRLHTNPHQKSLAGISRSPTIIVAYLMSKAKMALGDAFDLVKQKRPIIGPNPGFVEQLEEFERQLLNASRTSACKNPLVQPFIPQTVGGATGL